MMQIVVNKDYLISMFSTTLRLTTVMDYEEAKAGVAALLETVGYEELPEGHGRLVDADNLLNAMETCDKFVYLPYGVFEQKDCVEYVHYEDMAKCVRNALTIIESDKKRGER